MWQANQREGATPVDLAAGPEHCACVGTADAGVAVYRVELGAYSLLEQLLDGATFAQAVSGAQTTADGLARVLGWAFAEGLVVGVSPSAPA